MRRRAEGGVGVAEILHEPGDHIVGAFGPGGRRAVGKRGGQVDHRGQRLVVDDDMFGGVFGEGAAVRDNHRNRLAHMANLVARQDGLLDGLTDRRIRHLAGDMVRRPMRREVVMGVGRVYARQVLRRRRVDRQNAGMRIGAAHEMGMQHVGIVDVVGEPGRTPQQCRVFHAFDALSEHAGNRTGKGGCCHLGPVARARG